MIAVADSLRAFDRRSPARAELLGWLLGHGSLHNSDWLASEVLEAELDGGLDQDAATAVRDRLVAILDGALRREHLRHYRIPARLLPSYSAGSRWVQGQTELAERGARRRAGGAARRLIDQSRTCTSLTASIGLPRASIRSSSNCPKANRTVLRAVSPVVPLVSTTA